MTTHARTENCINELLPPPEEIDLTLQFTEPTAESYSLSRLFLQVAKDAHGVDVEILSRAEIMLHEDTDQTNRPRSVNLGPTHDIHDIDLTVELDMLPEAKRRNGKLRQNRGAGMIVSQSDAPKTIALTTHADAPGTHSRLLPSSDSEMGILASEVIGKTMENLTPSQEIFAQDSLLKQRSSLSRYLAGRTNSSSRSSGAASTIPNDRPEGPRSSRKQGENDTLPRQVEEDIAEIVVACDPLDDQPVNPEHVQKAVKSVIQSSSSLPNLPLVVNNDILNKRSLVSALEKLNVHLHGHDSLEADFLLDARTACLHLPLMSLPSTIDQLIIRATMLAHRFEHLIFVFSLYPSEKVNRAILPDPWNSATRDAFSKFQGRLKRHIAVKFANTYRHPFSHTIDVYLSGTSMTLAALLRVHLEQAHMPLHPLDLSRWTTESAEEAACDWLSNDLGSVSPF